MFKYVVVLLFVIILNVYLFFTTDEAAYTIFAPTDRALAALPQDKQQDPKFLNGSQILIIYFFIKIFFYYGYF